MTSAAAPRWAIKQHSTGPDLRVQIVDEQTGLGHNLTGETLVAHMYDPANGVAIFTGHAVTLEDAVNGIARMAWDASDTAVAGTMLLELESSPSGETYPTDGYIHVEIRSDLNGS